MLVRSQKLSSHFADIGQPSGVRFLGSVKSAEVLESLRSVLFAYRCIRPITITIARFCYTTRQRPLTTPIPRVLSRGRYSQVLPSVVRSISIFMVDLIWPFSGLHKPNQLVRPKLLGPDHDMDTPILAWNWRTCWFAWILCIPSTLTCHVFEVAERSGSPRQCPGFGIIRKALVQVSL